MAIELGANPWILIGLMFGELLLILIPALIASKIEKSSIKEQLIFMGFQRNKDPILKNIIKVLAGILIGFIFFFISGYIAFFFKKVIIENLFGTNFYKEGQKGSINSQPIRPTFFQLIIIIILQFLIIALCEETFFRGFIIKKIEKKTNNIYAILFSSICFAIYHTPPFLVPLITIIVYFGYFFTFGVLLSITLKVFDYSLIPCIIAHGLFNTLILIF